MPSSEAVPSASYLFFFRPPVHAPRTQVFAALTEPAQIARYLGEARADLRKNGIMQWADTFGGLPIGGEIQEFIPGEGFDVRDDATGGHFAYRLVERLGRTIVDVRFFSEPPQPRDVLDRLAHRTAWQLAALKAYLERGERLEAETWRAGRPVRPAGSRIVRRSELSWQPSSYEDDPEVMGFFAPLTAPLGANQIGADLHRLEPGQRNSRNHSETDEEEAFFVVSGSCKVEIEGAVHALEAGDFVLTFPGDAHYFFNDSESPCEILGFGGPDLPLDGAIYPGGKDLAWRDRVGMSER